jgi:hypothetical protein
MNALKPNGQRAKNAMVILWILLGMEVLSFISHYFQYDLLQRAANGAQVSTIEAGANDLRELIISIAYIVTYIIFLVIFIQWFRRAYYNLQTKVPNLLFTDGWAAGSWFVPILNFYRPFQIMREIHTETIELFEKKGVSNAKISTDYLGWWWFFWITSGLIGRISSNISMDAESIRELTNSTMVEMISNVVSIPLILLFLKIVSDYSKVEPILFELKDEEEVVEEKLITE